MTMQPASSRILYDMPCKVCWDHSSGKFYGAFACDRCASFFKRSIRRNRYYVCKAESKGECMVDKTHTNRCRACRLAKCIQAGMNKDAVQHQHGPRKFKLSRQMALSFKDPEMMSSSLRAPAAVFDLASSKPPTYGPMPNSLHCNSMSINTIPMNLGMVTIPILPAITAESVYEQAARLLFLNVRWAYDVTSGTGLSMEDQLTLLRASWRELFLLVAAHMEPNLDPSLLLPSGQKSHSLANEVTRFKETLAEFVAMSLDPQEFSCLRAIAHFQAGLDCQQAPGLSCRVTVARLRDNVQLALGERLSATFSSALSPGAMRFGQLILLLPSLRSVSAHAIVELFFRRTIADTPIEKIICDMYKAQEKI